MRVVMVLEKTSGHTLADAPSPVHGHRRPYAAAAGAALCCRSASIVIQVYTSPF